MGESGIDIKLSSEAKKQIPYDIECKAVERLNLQQAYEQACKNSEEPRIPIVIHKKSRKNPLVTLSLDHFLFLDSCRKWLDNREK